MPTQGPKARAATIGKVWQAVKDDAIALRWIVERENLYFDGPAEHWVDAPEDMIAYCAAVDWQKYGDK